MKAQYFTLLEFTRSHTASLRAMDNTPPRDVELNLEWLCSQALDPLREALGCPVIVTSGYRCPDLNTAVGGSPTSYHLLGLAADIYPLVEDKREQLIALITEAKEKGDAWKLNPTEAEPPPIMFTEAIIYPTFVHIAVAPEGHSQKFKLRRYNGYGQGYKRD